MRRLGQPLAAGVLVAASVALVAAGSYRPTEQGPALALLVSGLAATASGLVVSLAVIRPWWGLLAFVGVAPVINVARAELWVGPIQVIPATLVVLALAIGVALGFPSASVPHPATGRGAWAWLAIGAALATASTIASRSRTRRGTSRSTACLSRWRCSASPWRCVPMPGARSRRCSLWRRASCSPR
jgi:hypothetical protein